MEKQPMSSESITGCRTFCQKSWITAKRTGCLLVCRIMEQECTWVLRSH